MNMPKIDKLQVGTGDIDTSDNTLKDSEIQNSDVKVTTNNMTSIEVKDGGTLKYKDAAAIKAEHEERRKDFEAFKSNAKGAASWMHDNMTLQGKIEKGTEKLEAKLDKLCGVKPSRFDSAVNMSVPANKSADNKSLEK